MDNIDKTDGFLQRLIEARTILDRQFEMHQINMNALDRKLETVNKLLYIAIGLSVGSMVGVIANLVVKVLEK